MLFIQSNSLALSPTHGERLRLLDALAAKSFIPLILSTRRHFFQSLLTGAQSKDTTFVESATAELESVCVARQESHEADAVAYTPGELFFAGDCALYLVFGGSTMAAAAGVSAGIIYSIETAEPLAKFERFCADVREALSELKTENEGAKARRQEQGQEQGQEQAQQQSQQQQSGQLSSPLSPQQSPPADPLLWRTQDRKVTQGLARFIATQPADFVRAAVALRGGRGLARASKLMERSAVRLFLRRAQEMRREGYTPRRLFTEAGALLSPDGVSVEHMLEAGLLEREVRVSCRKSGHALFDLPSPDSLAAITISKAKCSLCAASVADEVVEETINPTRLAVSLLEDGRWLSNRVYSIVRSLGVPDSEIATAPASAHGESYLLVEVCRNSFLFVTKDGDVTPAFCRRVVEIVEETEAAHLVVVTTGAVEDEGRMRLYEFAWRRARDGRDLGTTLVEGLSEARAQIERAFESAVRREMSHNLFTLDAALGFNAGNFVLEWFKANRAAGEKNRAAEVLRPLRLPDLDRQVAS